MDRIRTNFYKNNVEKFFRDKSARILVCGAGSFDKYVFESLGYKNVTISNLDSRMKGNEYAPFRWAFEDAEKLSFPDNSFDYVAIHAAIHHGSSPHRMLTEMYRVAAKGVLAIESRDSLVMRFSEKYGLVQVYEHAAVYYNDGKFGGVNNSEIPNYVYRWTEREVEKTIQSFAPYANHKFHYSYETTFPVTPEMERNGVLKYGLLKIVQPFFWLLTRIFKRQQNLFAFFIEKPELSNAIFPWIKLTEKGIGFNDEWASKRYRQELPNKKS
jgi:SAM-dependent methyltransferase